MTLLSLALRLLGFVPSQASSLQAGNSGYRYSWNQLGGSVSEARELGWGTGIPERPRP